MSYEVKEIPFADDSLLGIKTEDGQVWLGVKKACLGIGLSEGQAQRMITNIQNEEPMKSNCCKFAIVQNEGNRQVKREQVFLNERVVTLWLAKISLTPTMQKENPDAYQKLLKYQIEAAEVLHKAFYETEEQKEGLHEQLGLEGRILSLEEIIKEQSNLFSSVMENMTISTRQQEKILKVGRERINELLGGAHSEEYKKNSRKYFSNMWNCFKDAMHCGSTYKDLNPVDFKKALEFLQNWEYAEH